MARFKFIQNAFTAGEISPNAQGRSELNEFIQGCREIRNKVILPIGGAVRRAGTQFIASQAVARRVNDASDLNGGSPRPFAGAHRIIPFVFSKDEAYQFIFKADGTDTAISIINANSLAEAAFTSPTQLAGFTDAHFTGWSLNSELFEAQYAQTGDIILFTHPNYPPFQIRRTGTDTFEKREYWDIGGVTTYAKASSFGAGVDGKNFARAHPFRDRNIDASITLAIVGAGTATITASKPLFNVGMIGTILRVTDGGGTQNFMIDTFTSSTIITAIPDVIPLVAVAGSSVWQEAAWSDFRGWPRAICFFQQRIEYGGNNAQPNTIWGSQIGDIFELAALRDVEDPAFGTITNDRPFAFTVASVEMNLIQWLSPGKTLSIGTLGREYIASGQGAIGPLDIEIAPETAYGSDFVQPLRIASGILFVQRSGVKIREFVFNDNEQSFRARDVTIFADQVARKFLPERAAFARPSIRNITYQESEDSVMWGIDFNGGLFGITKDNDVDANAAHFHFFGGDLNGEIPFVHSISVVPNATTKADDLWIAVERTINGGDVTYIEKIGKRFEIDDVFNTSTSIIDKMVYSDSAKLVILGAPAKVFSGFGHLEGQTLDIVADGAVVANKQVISGDITLDDDALEVVAGLNYISRIDPLELEAGAVIGTSQSTIKRVDQATIRFHRTIHARIGPSLDKLKDIEFRPADLPMDDPIPLFTGDKIEKFEGSYDRSARVIVEQNLPLPMTVVAVISRGVTYDG